MKQFSGFPKVLRQKIVFTLLIGAGCFVFGCAYGLFARDRVFFLLSCAVLAFCLYRGWTLYRVISRGEYVAVEGTCVGVSSKLLRKQFTVRVMDDGVETSLRVGKQTKVKIGVRYRFYFRLGELTPLDSDFLNSLLVGDLFLGVEVVGDGSMLQK